MADTFRVFHNIMSLAGISIYAKNKWNSNAWLILQYFSATIGVLNFVLTTCFVIDNLSDLPVFIEGACIWTTCVIMSISLVVCVIFRQNLRQFLNEMAFRDAVLDVPLIEHVMNCQNSQQTLVELKNLVIYLQEKLHKMVRFLLKIYVMGVFLTATLYICGAVYRMLVREDPAERILAFEMWFPWSLEDMRVYTVSFIFHSYSGYLCCVAYPGFQSTIVLLVGQIIRQLKILTFILNNLSSIAAEITSDSGTVWQECCTNILSQCIKHYVQLKRFSNRLNIICRPFYLTLILVAIMLVCVCSVKIAISNKLALEVIKYYVHEFCFIMVVLMFCSLGQQLQNECEKVEEAILEKWHIFDSKHKKHLLIFKMAASQRMPIYIFGTITLSLPTFTWFIKTVMSFFTLMMSFLDEQT